MEINCPECLKNNNCKVDVRNGKCINYSPDNVSYAQHRLFRGLLLPAITEAMGESNNQYVHDFILKPEWIYRQIGQYYYPANGYNAIPEKHQGSARVIEYFELKDGDNFKPERVVVGYVPSMAKFTKSEAKDYIRFCEIILEEVSGNIPVEYSAEYNTLRQRVMK